VGDGRERERERERRRKGGCRVQSGAKVAGWTFAPACRDMIDVTVAGDRAARGAIGRHASGSGEKELPGEGEGRVQERRGGTGLADGLFVGHGGGAPEAIAVAAIADVADFLVIDWRAGGGGANARQASQLPDSAGDCTINMRASASRKLVRSK